MEVKARQSTMGIWGFILSFVFFPLGFIFSLIDVCRWRKDTKHGLAIAGLAISVSALLLTISTISSCTNAVVDVVESGIEEYEPQTIEDTEIYNESEGDYVEYDSSTAPIVEYVTPGMTVTTNSGVEFIIVSIEDPYKINENSLWQCAEGNRCVKLVVEVHNNSDEDFNSGSWDFECYADGYEGSMSLFSEDGENSSCSISSGHKAIMTEYFEVPEDATDIEFEWAYSLWVDPLVIKAE